MNQIIKEIEEAQLKDHNYDFNVGDTVKVYGKIKEGNRERIQVYEGTVIKIQGGSNRQTFTVRKSSNGVGVEKTWPMHSPNVEKVEVTRRGKVRRAKLLYLRDRIGKKAKNAPQGCARFCSGIMSLNATGERRRISRCDILCSTNICIYVLLWK